MKYDKNNELSRTDLFNLLPRLTFDKLSENDICLPPKPVNDKCEFKIVFERQPLCIGGRLAIKAA